MCTPSHPPITLPTYRNAPGLTYCSAPATLPARNPHPRHLPESSTSSTPPNLSHPIHSHPRLSPPRPYPPPASHILPLLLSKPSPLPTRTRPRRHDTSPHHPTLRTVCIPPRWTSSSYWRCTHYNHNHPAPRCTVIHEDYAHHHPTMPTYLLHTSPPSLPNSSQYLRTPLPPSPSPPPNTPPSDHPPPPHHRSSPLLSLLSPTPLPTCFLTCLLHYSLNPSDRPILRLCAGPSTPPPIPPHAQPLHTRPPLDSASAVTPETPPMNLTTSHYRWSLRRTNEWLGYGAYAALRLVGRMPLRGKERKKSEVCRRR